VNAAEALALFAVALVVWKVLGPIAAGIGHRIRGRDSAPDHRVAAEVDELRTRLAEVEERLDFAERLLARNEPEQIRGGASR
jgi:hypothetical protein